MRTTVLKIAVTICAILAPAAPMILTALGLCITDLITGVIAARKRGEAVTSAGLGRTVVKLLVYEAAIVLSFLTQKYLTGDVVPVSSIAASMIGMTELLSCLENLNDISGNSLLKSLIAKLGSKNQ